MHDLAWDDMIRLKRLHNQVLAHVEFFTNLQVSVEQMFNKTARGKCNKEKLSNVGIITQRSDHQTSSAADNQGEWKGKKSIPTSKPIS